MNAIDPKETELKVLLTPEELGPLQAKLGAPARTVHQTNYYFDTPNDDFANVIMSLRIREEKDTENDTPHILLTVKGQAIRAGALVVRPEIETQLDDETWSAIKNGEKHFSKLNIPPITRLSEQVGPLDDLNIELLGHIVNERDVYVLSRDGLDMELLLDKTTYPDGETELELECEMPQSMAGSFTRVMRDLLAEVGIEWRPAEHGKYVRFRRKIGRPV